MFTDDTRLSLADLAGAGVRLFPFEAVTIAREVLMQVARGEVPGVPSAHVIRLGRAGTITVEGPVAAGGRAVSRAAQLLDALLPPKEAGADFKVPGALRLCIVRGLGMLDVPAYPSIESFAEALQRFSVPDSAGVIRTIVQRYDSASAAVPQRIEAPADMTAPVVTAPAVTTDEPRRPEPKSPPPAALARLGPETLTISDIRRARRATGLSLSEVSGRSRIPVSLLRQLEWGYLLNWPEGLYGRTQLVRYARAAGLDEQIVIATVWPMLDEIERVVRPHEPEPQATEAVAETPDIRVEPVAVEIGEVALARTSTILSDQQPNATVSRRRGARTAVALAIAALLLLVVAPFATQRAGLSPAALWNGALDRGQQPETETPQAASAPAPAASVPPDVGRPPSVPAEPDAVPPPAAPAPSEAVKASRLPERPVIGWSCFRRVSRCRWYPA